MKKQFPIDRFLAAFIALLCFAPLNALAAGGEPLAPPEAVLPPAALESVIPTESPIPVGPSAQPLDEPTASPTVGVPAILNEPEVLEGVQVLVGLCYDSTGLAGANLKNEVGKGYRFGYLNDQRNFVPLGSTEVGTISVVKTQNVYYGQSYGDNMVSYGEEGKSDIMVGCWHVRLPESPATFDEAKAAADTAGGFPAWIDGAYQARVGAYATKAEAQERADALGGTVVGTSSYGVSVVKTGTAQVLFQFDSETNDKWNSLTVMPIAAGNKKPITWFKGNKYYGVFHYRRVAGGNLTVSNLVELDDYANCVCSREMSNSWPLEALKAQAVCARTYYETNLGKHKDFDICATVCCQAYHGMATTNARTEQAAAETAGLRVWYDGKPAKTYYSASNGGGSEDIRNVWGGPSIPYLCGVVDPYEATIADKIDYWGNVKTYTATQLNELVQPQIQKKGYNCAAIVDMEITELSPTGNVKTITFTDANGKTWPFTQSGATEFRGVLGLRSIRYSLTKTGETMGGLYYIDEDGTLASMSGVYAVDGKGRSKKLSGNPYVITASGPQFLPAPSGGAVTGEKVYTFTSYGWGHSLGMSQQGARAMALLGKDFREILTFYFPGIEIY